MHYLKYNGKKFFFIFFYCIFIVFLLYLHELKSFGLLSLLVSFYLDEHIY